MTDHDLDELMERLGDRTPVGPPPLSAIRDDARRSSRRRLVVAGLAAAVAVAGGTALVTGLGGTGEGPGERADVFAPDGSFVPPDGTRAVGLGHVVVTVPEVWGTNEVRCGAPVRDTVVLHAPFEQCLVTHAPATDTVELHEGPLESLDVEPGEPVEVDGHDAEATPVECRMPEAGEPAPNVPGEVCTSYVYFSDVDTTVVVRSSREGAAERVRDMLGWVHWVEDQAGIPGFTVGNEDHIDGSAGRSYVTELEGLGLVVETVTERAPGVRPGNVAAVDPVPGTVVPVGSTVTVTVAAGRLTPADDYIVQLTGPGDLRLEDAEIRAGGAEMVVPVGSELVLWPDMDPVAPGPLFGRLRPEGVLEVRDESGPRGTTWVARRPGTTRMTIELEANDRSYEIGTVTVIVE